MTHTDKPRFASILTALAETFDKELSEAVIGLYYGALRDLSIDAIEKACGACVLTATYMPRPAEIRERAGAGGVSVEDRSLMAWAEVHRATSRIGSYRSVEVYDPATAAAIDAMGGWPALCLREDEAKWIERDFRALYKAFATQGLQSDGPTRLLGIHEADNPGMTHVAGRIGGPKLLALPKPQGQIA